MKIGYDLDGVFLTDWYLTTDIPVFLEQRKNLPRKLFTPDGDYVIVTGRPKGDAEWTQKWIARELTENRPKQIFHQNDDLDKAAEYKAKVINDEGLDVFIESDLNQVKVLTKKCPKAKIVHFESLIKGAIAKL